MSLEKKQQFNQEKQQVEQSLEEKERLESLLKEEILLPRLEIIEETEKSYKVEFDGREYLIGKSSASEFYLASTPAVTTAEIGLSLELRPMAFLEDQIFQDETVPSQFKEIMIVHEIRELEYKKAGFQDAHNRAVNDEILYALKYFETDLQRQYFEFAQDYRAKKKFEAGDEEKGQGGKKEIDNSERAIDMHFKPEEASDEAFATKYVQDLWTKISNNTTTYALSNTDLYNYMEKIFSSIHFEQLQPQSLSLRELENVSVQPLMSYPDGYIHLLDIFLYKLKSHLQEKGLDDRIKTEEGRPYNDQFMRNIDARFIVTYRQEFGKEKTTQRLVNKFFDEIRENLEKDKPSYIDLYLLRTFVQGEIKIQQELHRKHPGAEDFPLQPYIEKYKEFLKIFEDYVKEHNLREF